MVWYFLFLCGNSRPASKSRLCCDTLQDFAIQEKELPLNILCGSRLCCSWVLTSCICRTGKRIATEQQYKFYFWAGLFYQWTTFPNWSSDTATRLRCGGCLGRGGGQVIDVFMDVNDAGERPLRCEQCDYSCAQAKHLKWHTFTHTGEKLIHSGEKPFVCKQCNYSSAEASKLKRHMQTHSGEKPFLQTVQLVLHRNFKWPHDTF